MFEFEKICRTVEKMDPATYAVLLAEKSKDVIAGISNYTDSGVSAVSIYLGLVLGAVVSDGKLSEEEFIIIKPMLDVAFEDEITFENAKSFLKYYKQESKDYKDFIGAVAELFGCASDELKTDIVTVCLLICGIDGKISIKERMWLKQLIG